MNAKVFLISATAAILLIAAPAAVVLRGQSLADVAREEEARRKEIKRPSKVYTNKDLGSVPPSAPAAPAAVAPADKDPAAKEPAADKDAKAGAESGAVAAEKPRDQAYWSSRMKTLRDQLDEDDTFTLALQSRINALTADFTARDDPAQRAAIGRDRQKSIDELDRVRARLAATRKAIAELEEEARRASVPPGWLR